MIRKQKSYTLVFLYVAVFFLLLNCHGKNEKLKVAVAANAQYAVRDIKEAYEQKYGDELELIVGSSGKLTAQIREGAPFDIFLSADMKYPQALYEDNLALDSPRVYAYGQLVLWTLVLDSMSMNILSTDKVNKIAIANPELAPYGAAAVEAMNYAGLYNEVKGKIVYGENVAQTSQYILSKSAEVGFTAKSLVLSPEMSAKGKWIDVDTASYGPIAQGGIILKETKKSDQAIRFYNFLFSDKAISIFHRYGYKAPIER